MRVHIGCDHAGFELKNHLVATLTEDGHEVIDHGPQKYDESDDYPGFCFAAAEAVRDDPQSLGLVIGGSGNGEQIAANKVKGIRAALIHNADTAKLAREHNNAQVGSIGARMHTEDEATELARIFLSTRFSGVARHERRIDALTRYDNNRD
jgi:ribose 5-phosphate isomerase B